MKKLLCLVSIVWCASSSNAAVFGDNEFTAWSDFDGIFHKIYLDVIEVYNEEICKRVLQWPQFVEDGELIFSLEDCLSFAEKGELSDFANEKAGSKTEIDSWLDLIGLKYDFEKQLWQQEFSLKRQLSFGAIWYDGDQGGEVANSPIDLVVSWNEVDEIMHGEKATSPNYKSQVEEEIEEWPEEPESDDWMNQSEDNLDSPSDYPDGEESFAGGFDEQKRNFNDIAANSLIPGDGAGVQQTMGGPFRGSPVPTSIQMNVDTVASLPESPDAAAQDSVKEEVPFGELQGIFSKVFEEQSAVELRETVDNGSRADLLHQIFSVDSGESDAGLTESIDMVFQEHIETTMKDAAQQDLLPRQQWNILLDTWVENLEKWKTTTEVFLTNPRQ